MKEVAGPARENPYGHGTPAHARADRDEPTQKKGPTMTTRSRGRRRSGLIRFLGDVLDDAKDFTDECLDRARDLEYDLRKAASDAVRPDEDGDYRPAARTARTRQAVAGKGTGT
ncbi:hypothetical protein [Streptomyces sp. NPDC008001]|uniref:hypothetical protein n=1 Tax=Streptomyces sp. NPDC008001 TaxID=3364804 RepID=UPI0036EECED2